MWWWVISPFYDFCCFWSAAINTVDKLLFFYIFISLYTILYEFAFICLIIIHVGKVLCLKYAVCNLMYNLITFVTPVTGCGYVQVSRSLRYSVLRINWKCSCCNSVPAPYRHSSISAGRMACFKCHRVFRQEKVSYACLYLHEGKELVKITLQWCTLVSSA